MGPSIVIPLLVIVVVVPVALTWAKRQFKDGGTAALDDVAVAPSARLTSTALRELPSPPWRFVYEIAEDKLGGIGHVMIGPAGIYAVRTSMDPLPAPADEPPTPARTAAAAIARGELDDVLRRCALSSDLLLTVHWGATDDGGPIAVETAPGAIAVAGRSLPGWVSTRTGSLTPAQVDLAWQTVTTAIGRPDPLG